MEFINNLLDNLYDNIYNLEALVYKQIYDIEKYPTGASNVEGAVDKILAGSFLVYPQVTT